MRVSLVVSSALLGVLSAFFAWAVHWAVSSYQEVTYQMPGTVTTLTFGIGPRGEKAENPAVVADDLRNFLAEHSLALVIASDGERAPQFVVADPEGVVPWYGPAHSNEGANQEKNRGAHVFEGTYSQQQWQRGASLALVPEGVEVVGAMPPPEGAGELQFVRPLGDYQLPPGEYVVNTDDPGELAELRGIVNRAGFGDHSAKSMPLGRQLTTDPDQHGSQWTESVPPDALTESAAAVWREPRRPQQFPTHPNTHTRHTDHIDHFGRPLAPIPAGPESPHSDRTRAPTHRSLRAYEHCLLGINRPVLIA